MAEYREDNLAWPTMIALMAEVENQIEVCGLPRVCRASVVPGPQAVLEALQAKSNISGQCDDGQAWVRFVTEYPSIQFPAADQSGSNCDSPLAYQLEVGIARRFPTGGTSGLGGYVPPTLDAMVKTTRLQMADKRVMRLAIAAVARQLDVAYSLGSYSAMQATGDAGGGVWLVTFWSQ